MNDQTIKKIINQKCIGYNHTKNSSVFESVCLLKDGSTKTLYNETICNFDVCSETPFTSIMPTIEVYTR